MKASFLIIFLCCVGGNAWASAAQQKESKVLSLKNDFGTVSDWHVTAWQATDKDFATGDTPAKLCFWFSQAEQKKSCTPITSTSPDGGLVYPYQTVRELEVVHPDASNPSASLLKFDAQYSGGGSGWLDQISFWGYDKHADRFELVSHITVSEQGEYRLFDKGPLKGMLLTADASQQPSETHFSPHKFYVEAYCYNAGAGFVKILGYLTLSKYPSLDDSEKSDVIAHEIPKIESLMQEIDTHDTH